MSLTVTIPGVYDAAKLQRWIEAAMPDRLGNGYHFTLTGSQLTIEQLTEYDRFPLEQAVAGYAAARTERQQVLDAYQANLDFIASTPTNAQVVAQVKALARQVNYLAKTLL